MAGNRFKNSSLLNNGLYDPEFDFFISLNPWFLLYFLSKDSKKACMAFPLIHYTKLYTSKFKIPLPEKTNNILLLLQL